MNYPDCKANRDSEDCVGILNGSFNTFYCAFVSRYESGKVKSDQDQQRRDINRVEVGRNLFLRRLRGFLTNFDVAKVRLLRLSE